MPKATVHYLSRRPNDLKAADKYQGYRWSDLVDNDLQFLREIIHDSGLSVPEIVTKVYERSGHFWMPHYTTIEKILNGKTQRPSNLTVTWIAYALGYERTFKRTNRPIRPESKRH